MFGTNALARAVEKILLPTSVNWSRAWHVRIASAVILYMVVALCANLVLGSAAAQGDGTGDGDNFPHYWEIHAALLTVGTVLFVGSYVALWIKFLGKLEGYGLPAIATRISRLWYKWHMYLGAVGVGFIIAGVIWGYLMVGWAHGGTHLRVSHSYVGFLAGCIAIVPILSGLVSRRSRRGRTALRWWHVALGLMSIVVMLAAIFSGWALG
jgi:hypothetical protein